MNFTKALTRENMEICGWQLEGLNRKPELLKNSFTRTITNYGRIKSTNNITIIINELTAMYTANTEEKAKLRILDEAQFSCSIFLGGSYFPASTYISLLILSFPIIKDVMKVIPSFNGNFFTPDILIDKVDFPDSIDSYKTKRSCIYNILKTLTEIGAVKKLKKGMYKKGTVCVIDAQGIEAALLTASELSEDSIETADLYLRPYSFEITKDFIEFYDNIDYSSVIPSDKWNEFINADEGYSLQYTEGQWTVSSEPYLYRPYNVPISAFDKRDYFTVEEIKTGKMRKIAIKGIKNGNPCTV